MYVYETRLWRIEPQPLSPLISHTLQKFILVRSNQELVFFLSLKKNYFQGLSQYFFKRTQNYL